MDPTSLLALLEKQIPVLISRNDGMIHPAYLNLFQDETLVFILPEELRKIPQPPGEESPTSTSLR